MTTLQKNHATRRAAEKALPSRIIGGFFIWARDNVARGLVAVHITPNMMTVFGMLAAITCGILLAMGPQYWFAAAWALVASGASDMLDGAVARIGNSKSRFGGILDSACDRVGDVFILGGIGFYYLVSWPAQTNQPANLTYALLAVLAIVATYEISYIKARAVQEVGNFDVGFWKRGERYACVLIGTFAFNLPMILWQLGIWGLITALQRLLYARRMLDGLPGIDDRPGLWPAVKRQIFFAWPRRRLVYDIHVGTAIALLIFARIPATDLLRLALQELGVL